MNNMSIKRASIINIVSRYAVACIQLVSGMILGRILTPGDYGIFAIITVFTTFFSILSDMGIGVGIIQNKGLSQTDIDSIFSFTIYAGLFLGLVFSLLSYPISLIYNNKVYISVGILLSFSVLFSTLNMVPNALMLKDKKFVSVGFRTVIINIICTIFEIILALKGFKYYALVLYSISSSLGLFLWNFICVKINIKFKLNWESLKKIGEISSFQFAFNIINYFSRNLGNLLIGKFMGDVKLGYYERSYRLMLYPNQILTAAITPVLHPILSEYQEKKDEIFKHYINTVKALSIVGIFIQVFCTFSAREIILIMYGNQWEASVQSFQFLSLTIWVQMIVSTTGSAFQSLGNTKLLFKTGLITTSMTIGATLLGVYLGSIEYVAAILAVSMWVSGIIAFELLFKKGFGYAWGKLIKTLGGDLVILLLLFAGMYWLSQKITTENIFISIFFKGIMCFILYFVLLLITGNLKYILNIFKKKK